MQYPDSYRNGTYEVQLLFEAGYKKLITKHNQFRQRRIKGYVR